VPAAASSTPGFWDWTIDPAVVLLAVFALLYWLGSRRP
jgi:hypothetical protein